MKYFGAGLGERYKELSAAIRKEKNPDKAQKLFLTLHAGLHLSAVTATQANEVDALLGDLSPGEYRMMPTSKDETIAWALWHLARIEDLTMNILVAEGVQIFDEEWQKRLNAPVCDTGNAMTDDEIMLLSERLDSAALLAYRSTVGRRTQEIVKNLSAADWKRKVTPQGIAQIRQAGGVTPQEESLWLLDYWGKKDVAGLLLIPPTRHALLHLNDCGTWKDHIRRGKTCFRTAQGYGT